MIEINDLTKYYGKAESRFKALDGVSVRINDGEFIVILGASGSGKSTFLNVISGLETSDGGCVAYDSQELGNMSEKDLTKFRRENTAYIFQQYYLLPHLNVPSELSGGEQQRVAIARALAKNPKVLFLDEPTGALDEETGRQVLNYIIRLHEEQGFTMIMVTHNSNIAETADRIIKMNSGKIVSVTENTDKKTAYEIGW